MPKYYCEYCDIFLAHSSFFGRKQHCTGRKHIQNKIDYFTELVKDGIVHAPNYDGTPEAERFGHVTYPSAEPPLNIQPHPYAFGKGFGKGMVFGKGFGGKSSNQFKWLIS
ncbi:hypothetical protein FOL47_008605 [Perkinsus chesapeaki]|uniref:Matrin-type domain-containing protein n=1 Tax=Perkinsus chesapeaki TaxID=330153 RepID=A0A7J6MU31_PERCH|nr:hypothetical protein FOL47_008605 [Perkinsus chesapeaki]